MPIDNGAYAIPSSRFRTLITAIGTALTPIVETVRYTLRLPDDEPDDKVVYLEFEAPLVLENESIESSQRSWLPFRAVIYGYVNEGDTRTLADFIYEISKTLFTNANIITYRDAFAANDGFSIERLTVSEVGFGNDFGQFKIVLECLLHAPD